MRSALAIPLFLIPIPLAAQTSTGSAARASEPLRFTANHGQWRQDVRFATRRGPMRAWILDDGWMVAHEHTEQSGGASASSAGLGARGAHAGLFRTRGAALRMRFLGARMDATPKGEQPLPGHVSFFLGNDPGRWAARVPECARLVTRDLYPGIDLVLRDAEGGLEYDLLLAPGSDLAQVVVHCEGADGMELRADGALVLKSVYGDLTQSPPVTWQVLPGGQRQPIASRFRPLDSRHFGFEAALDPRLPLVIDPGLSWSTYLGGSSQDVVDDTAADAFGVTAIGPTSSLDFPVRAGAYDVTHNGNTDLYVARFDPSQSGVAQRLWCTYLGGSQYERTGGLTLGAQGEVTFAAHTLSANFPTMNAYDPTHNGSYDGVVARLDATGSQLLYATFLGGAGDDFIDCRPHVDASGRIVTVAGTAGPFPAVFPTTPGAFQTVGAGGDDAFVARLDLGQAPAQQLVWSSLFGGSGGDYARPVAVDAQGIVTFAGFTYSIDLPRTAGGFPFAGGIGIGAFDTFVARVDPGRNGPAQLLWATYFGGTGPGCCAGGVSGDGINGLALDDGGARVVVAGWTDSLDLPTTANAFDRSYNGGGSTQQGGDVFVAVFDPAQPAAQGGLVYSTFLGGAGALGESAWDVRGDSAGTLTVSGWTDATSFPVTPGAWQTAHPGTARQGFVARLRPGDSRLRYATLLGGTDGPTSAYGFSLDDTLGVATGGSCDATNLWTSANAFQPTPGGGGDGYLAILDMLPRGVAQYGAATASCQGAIAAGVNRMPVAGDAGFAVACSSSPQSAPGLLLLTVGGLNPPIPVSGILLHVSPTPVLLPVVVGSDARGYAELALPLAGVPAGARAFVQFVWLNTAACGGLGTLSASNALDMTVQ